MTPPPPEGSSTYEVEVGHPFRVECALAPGSPPSYVDGFRLGNEGDVCSVKHSQDLFIC